MSSAKVEYAKLQQQRGLSSGDHFPVRAQSN
jgi:hypothetical protein